LSESSSQLKLLEGVGEAFGLDGPPDRIEVYDNSHVSGTHAVGAMIVAGPEGFRKNQYRKFNIRSAALTPGDDFGMMTEVLTRRFKRLLDEAPRTPQPMQTAHDGHSDGDDARDDSPWPDLIVIDGGQGQFGAAQAVLSGLGVGDVPVISIAKGVDRDAGRETFFAPGRAPFRLPPREPLLYFLQRLRDEAHRFAIGSHRQRRTRGLREGGLQEIPGVGPLRKRALLHHFGTVKAIERASLADIAKVEGISDEIARKIYDFFHEGSAGAPPAAAPATSRRAE
jgi:excinuclease ABC subunit C